ncbi:MAG: thioredoxin family protein, partial [Bacteroidetes bacterium]|nr:thioredoxin family protein [Bacteroidota bacterium]
KKIVFVDVRGLNPNSFNEKVDKEIFTLDSIADYFNEHVISIRINMGTEEGKKFAPRLAMLMYPVYVFHGSNGDQLDFTNAGSVVKDPGTLMEKARASIAINKTKNANTRAIVFTSDSWKAILQKAKSQNKLIFLDAQTTWCRPCIQMAKDVFTLDRVADYYNKNFINVSMDMEKGDGPALRKQYKINAYPTFLYIDGNGKLVHFDGGFQDADRFIKNGQTAVSNKAAGKSTGPTAEKEVIDSKTMVNADVIPFADAGAMRPAGAALSPAIKPATAPDTGMHFAEGSWASMLAKAKESGKLIFVDANTSWCGPCKQMRREIFPQKAVSRLYNSNFINVDLDMEKGEGIAFKNKYAVKAFPTFLYINGDGEVVHKTVGSCDALSFQQHALDAMSPHRNLRYLQSEYKNKPQDAALVSTYLAALGDAYETSAADSIALAYLQTKSTADWQQPANWELIKEYLSDASSPVFQSVVKDQTTYAKLYGTDVVETKIYQTYMAWPQHYLSYPAKEKAQLDREGFDTFVAQVKKSRYAKKAEIEARAHLTVYFGLREWSSYAATVNGMLNDHIIPMTPAGAEWLYSYADMINRFAGDDKAVLNDAANWTKTISYNIKDISPANKATYLDLYATLLDKTGHTDQAVAARKEIDQQQLNNAKGSAPFQSLIRIAPAAPKQN